MTGVAVVRGVEIGGAVVDAGTPSSTVQNCTVIGGTRGITIWNVPAAGTRTVRNCISSGGTTDEFYADAGAVATSLNNCAAGGGYSAHWPTHASDLSADPLFVDAANDNYHLLPSSPCVDTGLWVDDRTEDLGHDPISGRGMDRGCYEWQWQNPRSVRSGSRMVD